MRLVPGAPARCQRDGGERIETFQSDVHLIDFEGPPAHGDDELVVYVNRARAFCRARGPLSDLCTLMHVPQCDSPVNVGGRRYSSALPLGLLDAWVSLGSVSENGHDALPFGAFPETLLSHKSLDTVRKLYSSWPTAVTPPETFANVSTGRHSPMTPIPALTEIATAFAPSVLSKSTSTVPFIMSRS